MERVSTPSQSRIASRSRSGNVDFKAEDIKDDLAADIKNAKRCDVDHFLKHFLYLVLKDCDKKTNIDNLQNRIEELQSQRYYPNADPSTTGEKEGPVSEEEEKLIKEREKILNSLLHTSLNLVLPLANDTQVKSYLKAYLKVKSVETDRYAPYTALCNYALKKLENLNGLEDHFRNADNLKIQVARSDPRSIKSKYQGTDADIGRKPDAITTSELGAKDVYDIPLGDASKSYPEAPEFPFFWHHVLNCTEFKLFTKTLQRQFQTFWKEPQYHGARSHNPGTRQYYEGLLDKIKEPSDTITLPKPTHRGRGTGSNRTTNAQKGESQSAKAVSARVQCTSYGLEMLSHNLGVHHAINLLIIDDILWIWYFDRQGIIYSEAISFIRDFPRFLLILLAFQRFSLKDWGVIPILNPNAKRAHGQKTDDPDTQDTSTVLGKRRATRRTTQQDDKRKRLGTTKTITINVNKLANVRCFVPGSELKTVSLNLTKFLSPQLHCISGRATAVIAATGKKCDETELPMVCKLYHPEVQRRHEGSVLQTINLIAQTEDEGMIKHLPTLYFYGDLPEFTTNRIRSMVGLSWKGHRTTRLIGLKMLEEITTLTSGPTFVKAWLEVVTCHAFLWKNYVEHGDPSLDNMMYDPESGCGVLTDFDLSLLQWEPRVIGTDRTGTVPFMAVGLLNDKYWNGTIKRYYHHELESFIWVVLFVFLLYQGGQRQSNTHVTPWITSNYNACCAEKTLFYTDRFTEAAATVQPDYASFWPFADRLCRLLLKVLFARKMREPPESSPSHLVDSEEMWQDFIALLDKFVTAPIGGGFLDVVQRLKEYKPSFKDMTKETKDRLRHKYPRLP